MKQKLLSTLIGITSVISLLPFSAPSPVLAQSASADVGKADQALCLPSEEVNGNANCLLAGPAETLDTLAKKGMTFPPEPLSMVNPPVDLMNIPFTYARVVKEAVDLYASVADAQAGLVKGQLPAGQIKYVSLSQKETTEQGTFYQISTGDWLNSEAITRVSIPYFRGFLIKQFPAITFGWILQDAPSYKEPGYAAEKTGKTYHRLDIIMAYDSKTVDNMEWVMIGQDEWVEHRFIARVYNHPTPPEGVTNGRWIEVNLYEQVLTVYDQGKMVFATLMASGGAPFYTQPGTFKIYKKIEHEYMTGAFEADKSDFYYLEEVPFILYYDNARALHAAYWNTYLGYPSSHGCVNLSVVDAHWIYNWANNGDTVYVFDPSGKTPTDPSLYTGGGF